MKLESVEKVDCLIGEVTSTELTIRNTCKSSPIHGLQLDFKRKEQKHAEAAAVLFVEQDGTELKSEFSKSVCEQLGAGEMVRFVANFKFYLKNL